MHFSILYNFELNIFVFFLNVDWTKKTFENITLGLWEMNIFYCFLTFYIIIQSIINH